MTLGQKMAGLFKGLIVSYIITLMALLALAVGVYKAGISDTVLGILAAVVYVVSTFAGGMVTGSKVKERRFIWGALYGALYILIAFVISALLGGYGDEATMTCVTRGIMCVAGGMLGAMLSR